ncbi:MAG TPA: phosphatidylglycerol lysyltransferase domain-containing protein [Mobilitalea sp.]|nr:phosphatidylglycerol lysyltransferase domain-containing protein [Mobilitalea sp.]
MLSFQPITAESMRNTADYFKYKISRTSDYTVGAMYMWREFYDTSYTIYKDMLFYRVKYVDRTSFTYPVGSGSIDEAIAAIKEYCIENGLPVWFCTVPEEAFPILIDQYHGTIPSAPNRNWADYLYNAEDLSLMAGRKFSGQRNHINKFIKSYPNYRYQKITPDNLHRVIDFLLDFQVNHGKESPLAQEELSRALELLPLMQKFNLFGGFIEIDDTIIAMSVGEIVNDTLYVHVEKANRDYPGSYQMIVREFASDVVTPEVKYINREDDVGDDGLRTSKLSYHPIQLLDKYCILLS